VSARQLSCFLIAASLSLSPMLAQAARSNSDYLRDFRGFDTERRQTLIRGLERKIKLDPNPAIQRIVSRQRDHAKLPIAESPPYHRAVDWAKGVAPKRELIVGGDEQHTALRKKYPPQLVMPGLIKSVFYDWGKGMVVRRKRPLDEVEVMSNILNGYPPGSDDVLAQLLARFDDDAKMRKMASYLSHLYADLNAKVFEEVTLYEAWYSGELIDVPDVDAIPFARKILLRRAFRSPIPATPKRTALYKEIQKAAFAYRKYRTLRESAAAAFLHASPKMDPVYAPLVSRFHYLYVVLKDNPEEIHRVLRGIPDRDALVAAIDKRLKKTSIEVEKRLLRKKNLEDMHAWLRYWAQLAIFTQSKKKDGQ
jgi:hypothetical protein